MEIHGVNEGVVQTFKDLLATTGHDKVAASNLVTAAALARIEVHLSEVHNQLKGLSQTLTSMAPKPFDPNRGISV